MSRIGLTSHGFDAGSEAMRALAYWTGVLWGVQGSLGSIGTAGQLAATVTQLGYALVGVVAAWALVRRPPWAQWTRSVGDEGPAWKCMPACRLTGARDDRARGHTDTVVKAACQTQLFGVVKVAL